MWAPAALAAGAVVLIVIVLGGDGGDAELRRAGTAPAATAPAVDPLSYPRQGLRMNRPRGWTAELRDDVIRLRSGDGRAAVSIITRPGSVGGQAARSAAERAIRRGYEEVRVIGRSQSTLGGEPADTAELVARGRDDALVDVVIVGGASEWRSYAVTAVSLRPPEDELVREIGAVLDSVTFVRPES